MPALSRANSAEPPSVFVVGCPRSGSTLFYQSLVYAYRFAYVNNAIARYPRSGPLIARWLDAPSWPVTADFDNDHGATGGRSGVSEAGPFWNLVFPWRDHHTVEPEDWPGDRRAFARRYIAGMADVYGAPFVCKNVWHSVRLRALDAVFPHAAFIVMQRDPLLTARSILLRQRRSEAAGRGFWSILPRGLLDKGDLPLPEKVAWQILLTREAIEEARAALGPRRFFSVPYEAFCSDPEGWLDAVGGFLQGLGIAVERRARLGRRFEASRRCPLSGQERRQIEAVLDQGPIRIMA